MIYFTVPTPYFATETDVNIDRNPQEESSVAALNYKVGELPLEQSRADGINTTDKIINFSISNQTVSYIKSLDDYFAALKSDSFDITYPEGTISYIVLNWSITLINALYANITVTAEKVFL